MTTAVTPALRTVAFGSLDGGPWGFAWCSSSALVLIADGGAAPEPTTFTAKVAGAGQDGSWQLEADGLALEVESASQAAQTTADQFDQLCRVRGSVLVEGRAVALDSGGIRSSRGEFELGAYESLRAVWAWFEPGDGVALLALRQRKAKGHAKDEITAAVLEPDQPRVVADARLSTTYTESGVAVRAGLELWLDEEEEQQYPRRAAGHAVTAEAQLEATELELRAELFEWFSRGRTGAGIYLLGRRR